MDLVHMLPPGEKGARPRARPRSNDPVPKPNPCAQIYSIVKDPIQQDMTNDITKTDLGDLDTIFLVSYAVGMFFMGYFADRSNLRVFLGLCMIGAGIQSSTY